MSFKPIGMSWKSRKPRSPISTKSYGTLSLDKTERFMQEMQEGVDTAKYIGETFIKPMVEGKWNWEVTV